MICPACDHTLGLAPVVRSYLSRYCTPVTASTLCCRTLVRLTPSIMFSAALYDGDATMDDWGHSGKAVSKLTRKRRKSND